MTDDTDLQKRVEETAANYNIDVKSTEVFGDTLSVEADSHVNELSYIAALWFYKLSDYEFEKVAIRHSKTGEIQEYDIYEVLGRLVTTVEDDDFSVKTL